jgi:hypothetical protein
MPVSFESGILVVPGVQRPRMESVPPGTDGGILRCVHDGGPLPHPRWPELGCCWRPLPQPQLSRCTVPPAVSAYGLLRTSAGTVGESIYRAATIVLAARRCLPHGLSSTSVDTSSTSGKPVQEEDAQVPVGTSSRGVARSRMSDSPAPLWWSAENADPGPVLNRSDPRRPIIRCAHAVGRNQAQVPFHWESFPSVGDPALPGYPRIFDMGGVNVLWRRQISQLSECLRQSHWVSERPRLSGVDAPDHGVPQLVEEVQVQLLDLFRQCPVRGACWATASAIDSAPDRRSLRNSGESPG